MLGAGERFFGENSDKKPMRLVDTKTIGDGLVFLTYEFVRESAREEPAGLTGQKARARTDDQNRAMPGATGTSTSSGWEEPIAPSSAAWSSSRPDTAREETP